MEESHRQVSEKKRRGTKYPWKNQQREEKKIGKREKMMGIGRGGESEERGKKTKSLHGLCQQKPGKGR